MEIHAHVPKPGKNAMHWVLEGVFILVSVGVAFGAGEYREYRANRELAGRVLRSLQAEVEHNLAEVEPYLSIHVAWSNALMNAHPDSMSGAGIDGYVALRPPLPPSGSEFPTEVRRGAWDAALSTGSLRLLDYDVVAALSNIYQMQQFYGDNIARVVTAGTATTAFEPAARALVLRQLAIDMGTVTFSERLLIGLYKQHLPAIRSAAAASQ